MYYWKVRRASERRDVQDRGKDLDVREERKLFTIGRKRKHATGTKEDQTDVQSRRKLFERGNKHKRGTHGDSERLRECKSDKHSQ